MGFHESFIRHCVVVRDGSRFSGLGISSSLRHLLQCLLWFLGRQTETDVNSKS